jgi:hypothetical protein
MCVNIRELVIDVAEGFVGVVRRPVPPSLKP